jgi:DNA-directed RNA polymerase subunit RPC12/RpoP
MAIYFLVKMPTLDVKCKKCGTEFSTGQRLDEESWKMTFMDSRDLTCPHCGVKNTYYTPAFYFRNK